MEETLHPLKSMDCIKTLTKVVVNDKYIKLFQIGWFTSNTIIRFRFGHNLSIYALFEDPNLSYILDDKTQSTDTVIIVWLGWSISEQALLEAT